jgi:hypothetical protein
VGSAGPRAQVTEISWMEAVRFCNLLSQATGLTAAAGLVAQPGSRPSAGAFSLSRVVMRTYWTE